MKGIKQSLSDIFRRSIEETVISGEWKRANVTPIFKKGAKGDPANYRQVSWSSWTY